jgi:hypothetical protein
MSTIPRMTRWRARGVVIAALVAVGVVLLQLPAQGTVSHVALAYGDSLTYETTPTVAARFASKPSWRVTVRAYPYVALCDMVGWLQADLVSGARPTIITVETHGGDSTPCMDEPDGTQIVRDSPDYYAHYRADFDAFFAAATSIGARVVVFATPPDKAATSQIEQNTLTAIATTEAGLFHGVSISKAGRTALGGNRWRQTERCVAIETAAMGCDTTTDQIIVRAPDTVHFCPTGYADLNALLAGCPIYSSGAYRYGRALASAIVNPPRPILP